MTVPKIKTEQGYVPDIPTSLEPYVLGYALNADGETYTVQLDESNYLTPIQVRRQLRKINMLQQVLQLIQQDEEIEEAFEYAVKLYIYSPAVQKIANELGWTNEQLNQFFEEAKQIFV